MRLEFPGSDCQADARKGENKTAVAGHALELAADRRGDVGAREGLRLTHAPERVESLLSLAVERLALHPAERLVDLVEDGPLFFLRGRHQVVERRGEIDGGGGAQRFFARVELFDERAFLVARIGEEDDGRLRVAEQLIDLPVELKRGKGAVFERPQVVVEARVGDADHQERERHGDDEAKLKAVF